MKIRKREGVEYVYCKDFNLEGIICPTDDEVEPHVEFAINMSPDSLDLGEMDTGKAIQELVDHIKYLDWFKQFLSELHKMDKDPKMLEVESDFYWSDNDLLLRAQVHFNHPVFTKIKNKLYEIN